MKVVSGVVSLAAMALWAWLWPEGLLVVSAALGATAACQIARGLNEKVVAQIKLETVAEMNALLGAAGVEITQKGDGKTDDTNGERRKMKGAF